MKRVEARTWPCDEKELPLLFLAPLWGRDAWRGNSLELEGEAEKKSYRPERRGVL